MLDTRHCVSMSLPCSTKQQILDFFLKETQSVGPGSDSTLKACHHTLPLTPFSTGGIHINFND